jgi:hypothetical protein
VGTRSQRPGEDRARLRGDPSTLRSERYTRVPEATASTRGVRDTCRFPPKRRTSVRRRGSRARHVFPAPIVTRPGLRRYATAGGCSRERSGSVWLSRIS